MNVNKSEYGSRIEWMKACPSEYTIAIRKGYLEEICRYFGWATPTKTNQNGKYYWTKELCYEISLKCESRKEFKKLSSTAYNAANRNGWMDEICSHMIIKRIIWTKELCHEMSLKCETKGKFRNDYQNAYMAARRNGWFDECTKHME